MLKNQNSNNQLIKIDRNIYPISDFDNLHIIGDPGCDGLGAETMGIFAKAMTCRPADLSIIIGDIVPYGSKMIYDNVSRFINSVARHPIYPLCGNHDTDYYSEYFGQRNYALVSEKMLMVILDNSARKFTSKTLDFFRSTLKENQREHIVILFHIPPPVEKVTNCVNPPEWELLREIYLPYLDSIDYFVAGHVHSLAVDQIDGIPVIITGGGGARIEPLKEDIGYTENDPPARHHIVRFFWESDSSLKQNGKGEKLSYEILFLEDVHYKEELKDSKLTEFLNHSLNNEIHAFFKYRLLAEQAETEGYFELARLLTALSQSEYRHAKNHFHVLGKEKDLGEELEESIANETHEIETMYREYFEYAEREGHSLSSYTFNDARRAEKVHKELLEKALALLKAEKDIPKKSYYTCSSCGYTFETEETPERCPVCGAPWDKIVKES